MDKSDGPSPGDGRLMAPGGYSVVDWDQRFAGEDYRFGTEPSGFLPAHSALFHPGQSALLVADGEGRNSVWLAGQGLQVSAFDGSAVGLAKAQRLAAARGVRVDFQQADALSHDWSARQFDLVIGIFIQFAPPPDKYRVLEGMLQATRPGGLMMLHGYTPAQLNHGTGGPRRLDQLYTTDEMRGLFAGHEILELRDYEAELSEGPGHSGTSALLDLVLRRV